jgi:hypothetical protein
MNEIQLLGYKFVVWILTRFYFSLLCIQSGVQREDSSVYTTNLPQDLFPSSFLVRHVKGVTNQERFCIISSVVIDTVDGQSDSRHRPVNNLQSHKRINNRINVHSSLLGNSQRVNGLPRYLSRDWLSMEPVRDRCFPTSR